MNNGEYSIGRWISILYRYGQSHVSKGLEHLNIGRGQYVILLTLYRNGGISQEELADYLKLDKGSVAKSIKRLEDEAYIERSIDPGDRRTYKVFLTQKALDVIPVLQETIRQWEEVITSDLSGNERRTMTEILGRMAKKACRIKTASEELDK